MLGAICTLNVNTQIFARLFTAFFCLLSPRLDLLNRNVATHKLRVQVFPGTIVHCGVVLRKLLTSVCLGMVASE